MEKTLVEKLNVSIEEQGLEVFCRTLLANWNNSTVEDEYFCNLSSIGGDGRTCIISVKEGDIITFSPTQNSTTAIFMPLTDMPKQDGSLVKATADRTNISVFSANPLSYTIPAGTKYLIFYRAYSVQQSWNIYNIVVTKNGYNVRIPALDLWD